MQRIYATALTPEQYLAMEGHRAVRAEIVCPQCGSNHGLHRHGVYERGITGTVGQVLRIAVARFLCLACRRTVSYLPDFALSYRLVQAATFEAFLEAQRERVDVQRWETRVDGLSASAAAAGGGAVADGGLRLWAGATNRRGGVAVAESGVRRIPM